MKFIKLISISSLIAVGALLEVKTWIFSYNKADSGDLCFAKGSDLKNWEYIGGKDRAFFHSNLGTWGDKKIKELFLYLDKSGTWRCIWSISWDLQSLGHNSTDSYIPLDIKRSKNTEEVSKRVVASVVKDSKSKDAIVKIVNMLPRELDSDLPFVKSSAKISKTTLHGAYDAEKFESEASKVSAAEVRKMKLPPYSLTILRIKN